MFSTRSVPLRLAVAGAVTAAVLTVGGTAAEAALACPNWADPMPPAGSVTNLSSVGVGVIHLADGQCTHGLYDAILPPGENTRSYFDWGRVAGVYIGSGYRYVKTSVSGYTEYGAGPDVITTLRFDYDYTILATRR